MKNDKDKIYFVTFINGGSCNIICKNIDWKMDDYLIVDNASFEFSNNIQSIRMGFPDDKNTRIWFNYTEFQDWKILQNK